MKQWDREGEEEALERKGRWWRDVRCGGEVESRVESGRMIEGGTRSLSPPAVLWLHQNKQFYLSEPLLRFYFVLRDPQTSSTLFFCSFSFPLVVLPLFSMHNSSQDPGETGVAIKKTWGIRPRSRFVPPLNRSAIGYGGEDEEGSEVNTRRRSQEGEGEGEREGSGITFSFSFIQVNFQVTFVLTCE